MSGTPRQFGPETQGGVYLRGLSGAQPEIPTNFTGLEAAAQKKMTPEAWAYTAGSAGLETGADANRAAFNRASRSRNACSAVLATRNLGCEIFGVRALLRRCSLRPSASWR
jgi:lactate 2-monooxygenase